MYVFVCAVVDVLREEEVHGQELVGSWTVNRCVVDYLVPLLRFSALHYIAISRLFNIAGYSN
jgi:hypothetical protein